MIRSLLSLACSLLLMTAHSLKVNSQSNNTDWTPKQIKCLDKHFVQKFGINDLPSLTKELNTEDARIIGVGSFGSGIHEYQQLRDALVFQKLNQGYTTLLLPENYHAVNKLNAYVYGGSDDLTQALAGLSIGSITEEFEHFLNRVKTHNEKSKDLDVEFIGYEFSNPGPAIEFIRLFFIKEESAVGEIVDPILREFNKSWRLAQHADQTQLHLMDREVTSACNVLADTLQKWIDAGSSAERLEVYRQLQYSSVVVKHYAQWINGQSYTKRDSLLARNVFEAQKIFQFDRSVVTLDNFALSEGLASNPEENFFPEKTFGSYMNELFHDDFRSIGISATGGNNLFTENDPRNLSTSDLSPAQSGSIEANLKAHFQQMEEDVFLLDLSPARKKKKLKWLNKPVSFRTTTMRGSSNSDFVNGSLPQQYDLLVVFSQVRACQTFTP